MISARLVGVVARAGRTERTIVPGRRMEQGTRGFTFELNLIPTVRVRYGSILILGEAGAFGPIRNLRSRHQIW